MVTGSHNPPDHNGFKLVLGGKPFYAERDPGARPDRRAALGEPAGRARAGRRAARSSSEYVERLAQDYDGGGRPLNVAWDPATAPPARSVDRS